MSLPTNEQLTHEQHHNSGVKYPLSLLAQDIESVANVGSLFRLSDALGVECLYLCGRTPTPPDRQIRRTSRSTVDAVQHIAGKPALEVITALKSKGYTIISLELSTASHDIRQLALDQQEKICLILGAENTGVEQALLDAADFTLHIPMQGQNSSMNVAMAAAIAAYEITRHLRPLVQS